MNKERVRRLEKLGLMKEEGLRILPDMQPESFTINIEIETCLKKRSNYIRTSLIFLNYTGELELIQFKVIKMNLLSLIKGWISLLKIREKTKCTVSGMTMVA